MKAEKANQDSQVKEGAADGIITIKNLTKKFGDNVVLDDISLTIERANTTVVIGPSGCGKTVLIKHLIVLLRPNSGEVYFEKERIDDLPEHELDRIRTRFGFLFQGGALFDSLSVAENIMFPIVQHCEIVNWREIEDIVRAKLSLVGLDGFQLPPKAPLY